jgi:hypothetical protein
MIRVCCLVLAFTATGNALGQQIAPAKAFGTREEVQQISLSPAGDKVAYLAATGARGTTLYILI